MCTHRGYAGPSSASFSQVLRPRYIDVWEGFSSAIDQGLHQPCLCGYFVRVHASTYEESDAKVVLALNARGQCSLPAGACFDLRGAANGRQSPGLLQLVGQGSTARVWSMLSVSLSTVFIVGHMSTLYDAPVDRDDVVCELIISPTNTKSR